jgi:hypothetical protein
VWPSPLTENLRFGSARFVYVEYAAPEGCEVDGEDAWAAANPALGEFLYVDALRSTMRTTQEADFRPLPARPVDPARGRVAAAGRRLSGSGRPC